MEQVLMDLIDDHPVYLEIMQARFELYCEVQRQTLEAAGGLIDFTHAGEDFGNQRGPMIGPDVFERHFAPKYGKYFEVVHSHGSRTMLHICGCCEAFLARLIKVPDIRLFQRYRGSGPRCQTLSGKVIDELVGAQILQGVSS